MTDLRYDPTLGMSYDGMAESVTFELAGRLVTLKMAFRDAHAIWELLQLSYRRGVLAGCAHMSRRVREVEAGAGGRGGGADFG